VSVESALPSSKGHIASIPWHPMTREEELSYQYFSTEKSTAGTWDIAWYPRRKFDRSIPRGRNAYTPTRQRASLILLYPDRLRYTQGQSPHHERSARKQHGGAGDCLWRKGELTTSDRSVSTQEMTIQFCLPIAGKSHASQFA
jgi:hypothetical protein